MPRILFESAFTKTLVYPEPPWPQGRTASAGKHGLDRD